MSENPEAMRKSKLYAFHILMEAKGRALVVMMKMYHPEWNRASIKEVLMNMVDLAYEKDKLSDQGAMIAAAPPQALPSPPETLMTVDEMIGLTNWVDKTGGAGPFKLATRKNNAENPAYENLVKFLTEQKDYKKFLKEGRYVWLMTDRLAVGFKEHVRRRGRQS